MKNLLSIALVAAVCAASAGTAYGQFELTVEPGAGDTLALNWNTLGGNPGYAIETHTSLTGGTWRLAGSADDWPIADTNWSTETDGAAYFRGRAAQRGLIVSTRLSRSLTKDDINLLILSIYGFPPPMTATYPVDIHRITYETFDHRGISAVASGALTVPAGTGVPAVPLVSYQHGTIFKRTDAPSNDDAEDRAYGVIMSTDGYAVAMPDYLGLGTNSPPLHAYLHARSEAVACVDMMRASRTIISNSTTLNLNGKIFLVGYSQGGHATLALQKELEQNHAAELPVTASAPMAGPHDLSGTMMDELLSDNAYSDPQYLPYLLFGYNGVYGLYDAVSDALKAPYDTTLPPLFDGAHSSSDVAHAMPSVPKLIFKADYLAEFESNSNHPFRVALRANDTYRWTPQAKTRLYHCAADTVVPQVNSSIAYSNFVQRGAANVSFEDPSPGSNHSEGVQPCFEAAKAWFDSL